MMLRLFFCSRLSIFTNLMQTKLQNKLGVSLNYQAIIVHSELTTLI